MPSRRLRNVMITIFVIVWNLVFQYESLRAFYLDPWFGHPLPKVKFLFPPAGWIMFYSVDDQFGYAEVYGVKGPMTELIDPHEILETRFIGFDNIQRNVLSSVLSTQMQKPFCRFLKRKFPEFDNFLITAVQVPSITREPRVRYRHVFYDCE